MHDDSPNDRVGQHVGDYVLERLLGVGGMSRVYFARERLTGRGAAIKILQANLPANMAADRRLEQEARAITRIDHPNVVEVYGWGRTSDSLPYIAMEYLEGRTLAHLVSVGRITSMGRLLPLVEQMLSALSRAHALDIIHRDLKPDNVFLVDTGEGELVKMLDFGIAKLLGPQPHSLVQTVQGLVLGTPEYLPPELALGQDISPATDIYALGVILFEGLTGRLPFLGHGSSELAEQHCFSPPPRLRSINGDVPAELEKVVLRCLQKDPVGRYQTAEALLGALQPFLELGSRGPTLSNTPVGLPERREPGDNQAVERALRDSIGRRWLNPDEFPPALRSDLSDLDALHQRLDATGTELALVDDELADLRGALGPREAELHDALQLEASIADELRSLRRRDGELGQQMLAHEHGRHVLDALADHRGGAATDILKMALSKKNIEALRRQVGSGTEIDALTEKRRALQSRYTDLSHKRARAARARAEIEAELTVQRAHLVGEQGLLEARRMGLLTDLEALERGLGRVLAQTSLDLADALGNS